MSEQDARSAHEGGEMAAQRRQDHYLANIAGQGTRAGDPAEEPAPSTQVPDAPPPPDRSTT